MSATTFFGRNERRSSWKSWRGWHDSSDSAPPVPDDAAALFKTRIAGNKQRFETLRTAEPARAKTVVDLLKQAVTLGLAKRRKIISRIMLTSGNRPITMPVLSSCAC